MFEVTHILEEEAFWLIADIGKALKSQKALDKYPCVPWRGFAKPVVWYNPTLSPPFIEYMINLLYQAYHGCEDL